VVWDCHSWVVAVCPRGGGRCQSMEGVVVLREWGCPSCSFVSRGRRRTWAVNVREWGGPSTSVVVPIGGGWLSSLVVGSSGKELGGFLGPGGSLRAASSRLGSCAVVLWKWVSGLEMGRREHTIDGGGAFVPPTSCCSLSSFLCCLLLEIGCSGLSFIFLRIVIDVTRPDGPLAWHLSGLVVAWFVGTTTVAVTVVVGVGVVGGGRCVSG
jgi:hypothetical protein